MPDRTVNLMASAAAGDSSVQNRSSLRLCGARTRQGGTCRHIAMANGRCRFHGGLSTGPRTPQGIERQREAVTRHGGRSRGMIEFRKAMRELRAAAKRTVELV